ncbi:MAG TPA: metal-dependent hydrolase [Polyangiaceae bacterium]|nr:metal-dependent hydrolase [Polyangiaceae bacterium]
MASIGHVAVGLAAARLFIQRPRSRAELPAAMVAFSALSLLPDADVIAFWLRIPYSAPFGHRGASHSFVAAAAAGLLAGLAARPLGFGFLRAALFSAAVVASHGILDTLTDGGLGIALLWPFSNERFFAPWRPIPVAPIGMAFFSSWGMRVAAAELSFSLPLAIYAFWPRRGSR